MVCCNIIFFRILQVLLILNVLLMIISLTGNLNYMRCNLDSDQQIIWTSCAIYTVNQGSLIVVHFTSRIMELVYTIAILALFGHIREYASKSEWTVDHWILFTLCILFFTGIINLILMAIFGNSLSFTSSHNSAGLLISLNFLIQTLIDGLWIWIFEKIIRANSVSNTYQAESQ